MMALTPAVGTIAYLSGTVTDSKGNPLRNTLVEIWQVDNNGIYLHTRGGKSSKMGFQLSGLWTIFD
jgi:protocatechuate 3,4-dioxygenase beta subunit